MTSTAQIKRKRKNFKEALKPETTNNSTKRYARKATSKKDNYQSIADKDGLKKIRGRFNGKFSAVSELPVSDIVLKPEIFQGRTVPFAQETVNKIVNEGFDKSQEPIILFADGKTNIVISGHSRFEAAKRLKLKTIPVKFFNGDKDEAIDYALIESNRSGKAEGIESDIKAYLRAKQRGYNKAYLRGIFKEDSYISILQKLTYLNPKGLFIEKLSTGEANAAKSFPYLLRNAVWVGTLRKVYPELSNNHEKEIFDFFYKSGKGLKVKKDSFFNRIRNKVEKPTFDSRKPLYLEKEKEFDLIKENEPGFVQYRKLLSEIGTWNAQRLKKQEFGVFAQLNNKPKEATRFFEDSENLTKAINRALADMLKLRQGLKKEDERLQTGGLFG